MRDLDPDTAAEQRRLLAQVDAMTGVSPQRPSVVKRLRAWLARKDAAHDHNAGVRASRRRWRARRRDDRNWQRHHGGAP